MTQDLVDQQVLAAPCLERPVTLTFQGDWGQANMHRICGWLSQEIGDRSPDGSRFGVWSGRGGTDAVAAVVDGVVDIAITTPTAAASLLTAPTGRLGHPEGHRVRALGTLPQRDRLVVCVDAALGVENIEDLASVDRPLTVATSPDDGINLIGYAAHELLRASGIPPEQILHAGGRFTDDERPFPAIAAFARGEADVLIHEAIMMPAWQRVADTRPVRYLPIGADAARSFASADWGSAMVPQGFLPSLHQDLETLDFSDFLLLCRDDLTDDVAALAAWCMVATRKALEVQYQHIPPDRSPLTYPLQPVAVATAPIEIHPAAAAMYAEVGDGIFSEALIWS